jgi:hypothetical protein
MVDTGASHTCVDSSVIKKLGLQPTGTTNVVTPSTGGIACQLYSYDVGIILFHENFLPLPNVAVTECELAQQGFHVLLGCDVLAHCLLVYNGITSQFSLSF